MKFFSVGVSMTWQIAAGTAAALKQESLLVPYNIESADLRRRVRARLEASDLDTMHMFASPRSSDIMVVLVDEDLPFTAWHCLGTTRLEDAEQVAMLYEIFDKRTPHQPLSGFLKHRLEADLAALEKKLGM